MKKLLQINKEHVVLVCKLIYLFLIGMIIGNLIMRVIMTRDNVKEAMDPMMINYEN